MNAKDLAKAQAYFKLLAAHVMAEEEKRRAKPAEPTSAPIKVKRKRTKKVYSVNIETKEQLELRETLKRLKESI